jgi:hypothetical protein
MAFAREAIEALGDHWDIIQPINALVARLASKKVRRVSFNTMLRNHALVWQIKVFEQVALHRVVSLANGCMTMWNARDIYGSAVFARGMMETTAVVYDLGNRLETVIDSNDMIAARDLLADSTFGPRHDNDLAAASAARMTEVMTIISELDNQYPGTLSTYKHLS